MRQRCSSCPSIWTDGRPICRADNASASPWAAPSSARPTPSCSTNRCRTSTPAGRLTARPVRHSGQHVRRRVPGWFKSGHIETPFGALETAGGRFAGIGDRDLVILGIRPEFFADAATVQPSQRWLHFTADIDVTEWLGHELYAYVPYDAPDEISSQLRELQREIDNEQMRTTR